MLSWLKRVRLVHFSTYGGFACWGLAAYMAHPTLATLPVMLIIQPVIIGGTIALAHWEGKRDAAK